MRTKIALLVVAGLMLLGGESVYVGQSEDRVVYTWGVQDAAFTVDQFACFPASAAAAATAGKSICMVPLNRTLVLEEFGVIATDILLTANNENCELILETTSTGSDATGTEIATSSIDVGQANANSGKCGDVTIDGRGDNCIRTLDTNDANTVIGGGGWWAVQFKAGTSGCGGACVCSTMQGISINVVGHYQ